MPFFPICKILNTQGFCTIHNYKPNNWEKSSSGKKTLWAIYSDGNTWITEEVLSLDQGECHTFKYDDFKLKSKRNHSPLIIFQFRKTPLEKTLKFLPSQEFEFTKTPQWRSTVGFSYKNTQTSYQGEINPFPEKASLLTFHPFIQYGKIENFLAFVNLENSPTSRKTKLEIYNAGNKKFIDSVEVYNNSTNVIPLDNYNFKKNELPVFICRKMGGIPFGFGLNSLSPMLSLEHTHPPASFAIHGSRFNVQSKIKEKWFQSLEHKSKL